MIEKRCSCAACGDGVRHASSCAVHNAPALPVGPCDCGAHRAAPPVETLPDGFDTFSLVLEDGIFIKPGFFPKAGTIIPQHAHPFSHSTAVIRGAIEVFEDGKFAGIVRARGGKSSFRTIKANVLHTFRTIKDGTEIWCIHNADRLDADGHLEPSAENSVERAIEMGVR